jgi:photosystem II stability/assembly factor-like uncharacterized protein
MRKTLLAVSAFFLSITSNGQWLQQNHGFTNDSVGFYEMSLPDKNTAWAVCYDGWFGLLSGKPMLNFTRTIDGGATWVTGKLGNDRTLRFSNISAIDGQEAWVAMHKMDYSTIPTLGYVGFGKGGGVFHTIDGGVSWEHTAPGELFDHNSTPQFVYFKDKNHGIAMGDPTGGYWEVYLTNNKGKKWKRVSQDALPAPLDKERGWISGYAAIGNTIWFGTTAGRMYKSIDLGKTWTVHTVTSLPGTEVNEIAFLDDGLTGVAHLRNSSIGRTYVFSTTDGGLTWTNFFQPANWKNSRVTAVPGTNAFVSTSIHNPTFRGSAVSYDAGKTWTEIEKDASKAVCRFFDANTGYAGGLYVTGHPILGVGGLYKSQIVFQIPSTLDNAVSAGRARNTAVEQEDIINEKLVRVFPTPARNVINLVLPDAVANKEGVVSIHSQDGKLLQSTILSGATSMQLNVGQLPAGIYTLRITSKTHLINKVITIAR